MILSSDSYTQIIVTITLIIILSIIGVLCIKYWDKIKKCCSFRSSDKIVPEIVLLQKVEIDIKN